MFVVVSFSSFRRSRFQNSDILHAIVSLTCHDERALMADALLLYGGRHAKRCRLAEATTHQVELRAQRVGRGKLATTARNEVQGSRPTPVRLGILARTRRSVAHGVELVKR